MLLADLVFVISHLKIHPAVHLPFGYLLGSRKTLTVGNFPRGAIVRIPSNGFLTYNISYNNNITTI